MTKLTPAVERLRAESVDLGGGCYRSSLRLRAPRVDGGAAVVSLAAGEDEPEDEAPTVEDPDLLRVRFRFFSADTDLQGHMLRSPSAEVLQAKAGLWSSKMARADHTDSIRDLIGQTGAAAWHDSRGEGDPGGIEGAIDFDRRLAGNVAIGLERGWLTDVSSVVEVEWAPSHPDMDPMMFWLMLGEPGPDGRTVTRQITDVTAVHGVDVVDAGADPHAQRVDARAATETDTNQGKPPAIPLKEDHMDPRTLSALGLPPETSDDDVIARCTEASAALSALDGIFDSFSLTGDERNPDQVRAKAIAQSADFVPRAEFAALQAQLVEASVVDMIDSAVRLAKITAAEKPFWLGQARKDLSAVKAHLDSKATGSAVPLGVDAPPAKTDSDPVTVTLSATEQAMVDDHGLTAEIVIAARAK